MLMAVFQPVTDLSESEEKDADDAAESEKEPEASRIYGQRQSC